MAVRFSIVLVVLLISGCTQETGQAGERYTLYRNSPLEVSERVHFASFNASESGDFNRGNCVMAARLLNENVKASAQAEGKEPYRDVGFWCEPGIYRETGSVPKQFESSFPANSDSLLRW